MYGFALYNPDGTFYDLLSSPANIGSFNILPEHAGKTLSFALVFDDDLNNNEQSQYFTAGVIQATSNNVAPQIVSTPSLSVYEDQYYSYNISIYDENDGTGPFPTLVEVLNAGSGTWLTLNGNLLSGVPTNDDVGQNNVLITVTDPGGLSATQSFIINVINTNDEATFNFPVDNCGIYTEYGNSNTYEGSIDENTNINVGAAILCGYAANPSSGLVRYFNDEDGVSSSLSNGVLEFLTFDQENGYVNQSFSDELKGPDAWLSAIEIDDSMQGKDLYYQFKFTDDYGSEEISGKYFIGSILISEDVNVPDMGSIGLLALGLSILGLGAVRLRK